MTSNRYYPIRIKQKLPIICVDNPRRPDIIRKSDTNLFGEISKMRIIRYKKSGYLIPWKWRRRKPLYRFILDIPYALYFSIVPSREALNEVLRSGRSGGGMGTGVYWEPFDVNEEEYREITEIWRSFDLREVLKFRVEDIPDLSFVFDEEILAIRKHLDYLARSRQKYKTRFWKPKTEQDGAGQRR